MHGNTQTDNPLTDNKTYALSKRFLRIPQLCKILSQCLVSTTGAMWSKARVLDRWLNGFVCSNPAGSRCMSRECCVFSGRDLVRADPWFRGILLSVAYLSVIEESQRGGLRSLRLPIREEKSILHLQYFVCKTYWYVLIPSEFHRNKGF